MQLLPIRCQDALPLNGSQVKHPTFYPFSQPEYQPLCPDYKPDAIDKFLDRIDNCTDIYAHKIDSILEPKDGVKLN